MKAFAHQRQICRGRFVPLAAILTAFLPFLLWGCAKKRPTGGFPEITNSQAAGEHPPTPAAATAAIRLPEGFRVTLFASEPDVHQPIAFDIDDRGRLWVAECFTYEGGDYDNKFKDRIVILADHDQDGRSDERKVFGDQFEYLTGLRLGLGGVWILQRGQLEFIADRDRDDRPDSVPKVLLDGFDLEEVAHNVANGLTWGPDGWLYGRHGILATSHVGPPGAAEKDRTPLNCAIWRYHPQAKTFEVVTHGTTNPWGLDYDDHGHMFFTNNVNGHLWHVIHGAHFRRMRGTGLYPDLYQLIDQTADHYHWDNRQRWQDSRDGKGVHDDLGGGHSHCGGMIYLGDNWPEEYRGRIFMCNTHGRRVNQDILVRRGCGFVAQHAPDFLWAGNPWFRGVDLQYGPDGGVFLSDWTDLGECHDSDGVHRTSGRIYKVTYEEPNRLPDNFDLAKLDAKELVALLSHPNDWYVRHARLQLIDRAVRGEDMTPLHQVMRATYDSNPEITRVLRALWALYVTGGTDGAWLAQQLDHTDEHVRCWAVRLLVDRGAPSQDVVTKFAKLADSEPSGLVRLHLASALQRLPEQQRWEIASALARRAEDADDPVQPLMVWYGIRPIVAVEPKRAVSLLASCRMPVVRRHIARRLAEDIDARPRVAQQLVQLSAESSAGSIRRDILLGMLASLRGRKGVTMPQGWPDAYRVLTGPGQREDIANLARQLAVQFGDVRAVAELRALVMDTGRDVLERQDSLRALVANRPEKLEPMLFQLLADEDLATIAASGLAEYQEPKTPQRLLASWPEMSTETRAAAVATLTSRRKYAHALLDAVAAGMVSRQEIAAFHARQIKQLGDSQLTTKLERVWGIVRETAREKEQQIARLKELLTSERLASADLAAGRAIYTKVCGSCHKLFGEGGDIGPDLTGGDRGNLDYLLGNVVDASAQVAPEFRMSMVTTLSGRVISGMVVAENPQTLTIQTPESELKLDRSDIDQILSSRFSLMPDGLLELLTDMQICDLVAYVQSGQKE